MRIEDMSPLNRHLHRLDIDGREYCKRCGPVSTEFVVAQCQLRWPEWRFQHSALLDGDALCIRAIDGSRYCDARLTLTDLCKSLDDIEAVLAAQFMPQQLHQKQT